MGEETLRFGVLRISFAISMQYELNQKSHEKYGLVIPLFIPHQGCPHDCLFCNQQRISGVDKKIPELDDVKTTIELWLSRKNDEKEVEVAFYGGSFTCMRREVQERLLGEVQPYIKSGQVAGIRCSTRPDCVTNDTCTFLTQYRVRTVELGVQSLNDAVLVKNQRGHDSAKSYMAVQLLQEAGFRVGVQLMVGLPGERLSGFLETVDKTIGLHPDFVRLYPVVVVKESGLETMYNNGEYSPLSLTQAIAVTARSYQRFQAAEIPVVRMGLQASTTLEKSVVAGPYHPAFGDLVRSRLWLNEIRQRLSLLQPGKKMEIYVSHRDISTVVGIKRGNVRRLEALGFADRFKVMADRTMARGSVRYVISQ